MVELVTLASVAAAFAVCIIHFLWQGYRTIQETVEKITQVKHQRIPAGSCREEDAKQGGQVHNKKDATKNFNDRRTALELELSDYEKQIIKVCKAPLPRDVESLQSLVVSHRQFESDVLAKEPEVNQVKNLFQNIPQKTPEEQAQLDKVLDQWDRVWTFFSFYVERLKTVEATLTEREEDKHQQRLAGIYREDQARHGRQVRQKEDTAKQVSQMEELRAEQLEMSWQIAELNRQLGLVREVKLRSADCSSCEGHKEHIQESRLEIAEIRHQSNENVREIADLRKDVGLVLSRQAAQQGSSQAETKLDKLQFEIDTVKQEYEATIDKLSQEIDANYSATCRTIAIVATVLFVSIVCVCNLDSKKYYEIRDLQDSVGELARAQLQHEISCDQALIESKRGMYMDEYMDSLRTANPGEENEPAGDKPTTQEGLCPDDTWISIGGFCYFFGTDPQTQPDASQICQIKGASLASIHSFAENRELMSHMSDTRTWIGLVRDGDGFAWLDGSPLDFTRWMKGEPNNWQKTGEDCVEAYLNGGWNDVPCKALRQEYICKRAMFQADSPEPEEVEHNGLHLCDQLEAYSPGPEEVDHDGLDVLHKAVVEGRLSEVKRLLDLGNVDVNGRVDESLTYYMQATPLHLASLKGHLDVAELLIDRGANVYLRSSSGKTPLHVACQEGHTPITRLLIEQGSAVNAADDDGWTPLHHASSVNDLSLATLLVESGADVNKADKRGERPLHRACNICHPMLVNLAVELRLELTLYTGCSSVHHSVAELLIDHGADVDAIAGSGSNPVSALQLAVLHGNEALVAKLLASGADVNIPTGSLILPLDLSIMLDRASIARLLVEKGADAVAPMHEACIKGDPKSAKWLLEAGADANAVVGPDGDTLLHVAVKYGHESVVEELLASGANMYTFNDKLHTPVYVAWENGRDSIRELLIAHAD